MGEFQSASLFQKASRKAAPFLLRAYTGGNVQRTARGKKEGERVRILHWPLWRRTRGETRVYLGFVAAGPSSNLSRASSPTQENTRRRVRRHGTLVLDPSRRSSSQFCDDIVTSPLARPPRPPSSPSPSQRGPYDSIALRYPPPPSPRASRLARSFALSPLLLIHTSSFVAFVNRDNARRSLFLPSRFFCHVLFLRHENTDGP